MPSTLRPPRVGVVVGPPEGGVLREAWAHARRPFLAVFWRSRTQWLLRRGTSEPNRWRNPFWTLVLVCVNWLLALLLTGWVVRSVLTIVFHRDSGGWSWGGFAPDKGCTQIATSCGAVTSVTMPVLLLAVSTVLFLSWRLWRVNRFCTLLARTSPDRLVQTAGSLMDDVVGRDHLCNAIMNNLSDRDARRPHVVVGTVGSGKTALLVRLTGKLAAKGAVPIPLRLCDADRELDFSRLASERFREIVKPKVRSDAELDRIWRWLRQRANRIVVLADGLEEALNHDRVRGQRDNLIREAIRKADAEGLPLVIAARPHAPLRAMESAVTELEPLSAEAALHYIARGGSWRSDPLMLDRIVEVANMTESPLYLQIAKDLHRRDLLEPLWTEGVENPLLHDTWALRTDLLEQWVDALVQGDVHPELPIDQDTRQAVVQHLSALACIGLATDRAQVGLWELDPAIGAGQHSTGFQNGGAPQPQANKDWVRLVAEELDQQLSRYTEPFPAGSGSTAKAPSGPRVDVRLAATWGARMGLVHEYGETVRFQHSIMQAHLAARCLQAVFRGSPDTQQHISEALRRGGRELLIALSLYSRLPEGRCTCLDCCRRDRRRTCPVTRMRALLLDECDALLEQSRTARLAPRHRAAPGDRILDDHGSPRLRAIEVYGTAVEIDSVDEHPDQAALFAAVREHWREFGRGEDPDRLRAAKLALIAQCGFAARRVAATRNAGAPSRRVAATRGAGAPPPYRSLFEIGRGDSDRQVRGAIAREIGAGGPTAYRAMYKDLAEPRTVIDTNRPPTTPPDPGKAPEGCPPAARRGDQRERRGRWRRRTRDTEQLERKRADQEMTQEWEEWNREIMCAWMLPLLVVTTPMSHHLGSPRDDLEKWVAVAIRNTAERDDAGRARGLGLALAHGFKYAANLRPDPRAGDGAREYLIKQARELLQHSTFWYTRLTLLQALTLWALPDDVTEPYPIRGHHSDPRGQVREWLGDRRQHPLVEAAARLAVRALQTRRPERFLWIDETGLAAEVGTEVGPPGEQRVHNLWLPPSTGWSTLDPAAQQLLADVLLLVVLSERKYRPKYLFRFLGGAPEAHAQLPSCLSKDRTRLDPVRATGRTAQPGDNCTDDCVLKMCPYPAKVETVRSEFTEVFCLRLHELLRRWRPHDWVFLRFRRKMPWQRRVPVAVMRRFWNEMGSRARDADPRKSGDARGRPSA
ncbi:NACHT domain-containing protein [Streptomyces sp. NPDC016845]|uniref:NACHT domain-containing protein n=1 Tax=Streptomyces sp. NPDC016845 TaxID=3364972 RepID=UPI003791ACD0